MDEQLRKAQRDALLAQAHEYGQLALVRAGMSGRGALRPDEVQQIAKQAYLDGYQAAASMIRGMITGA